MACSNMAQLIKSFLENSNELQLKLTEKEKPKSNSHKQAINKKKISNQLWQKIGKNQKCIHAILCALDYALKMYRIKKTALLYAVRNKPSRKYKAIMNFSKQFFVAL